jgi:hypothetical protein
MNRVDVRHSELLTVPFENKIKAVTKPILVLL